MSTASSPSDRTTADSMSTSQTITLILGIAFTLVGVIGFAVTGTSNFAEADTGKTLLGFELNPLHNIVHLAVGVAGLLMWRTVSLSRIYGYALFAAYGVAFIYGLFTVNSTSAANFLSMNDADNGLHLVAALVGLAAGMLASAPAAGRMRSMRGQRPKPV